MIDLYGTNITVFYSISTGPKISFDSREKLESAFWTDIVLRKKIGRPQC